MGHSHHHHTEGKSEKNIRIAFFLNLTFTVVEIIGGLLTNSVAILSDALHDLGDSLTLGLSWYFAKVSKRGRSRVFSYGYKRFSLLGAIISCIVLSTGSLFIALEAIPRIINPVQPKTGGMILLALGGVAINGIAAYRLSKGQNLNERAVYVHLLEDVLGWVATLIGAVVMNYWNVPIIDPLLSVFIAAFILYNVIKNLRESFRIIMQGTPSSIDIETISNELIKIPQVESLHDCHAWSMDGEYNILSVHLVVERGKTLAELETIKNRAKSVLEPLGINHTTIEFETEDGECEPC